MNREGRIVVPVPGMSKESSYYYHENLQPLTTKNPRGGKPLPKRKILSEILTEEDKETDRRERLDAGAKIGKKAGGRMVFARKLGEALNYNDEEVTLAVFAGTVRHSLQRA